MTLQDLLALPDGELNRRAAAAMGWDDCWDRHPATDHNDAARMRQECDRPLAFAAWLLRIVSGGSHSGPIGLHDLSKVANATPREITAAS